MPADSYYVVVPPELPAHQLLLSGLATIAVYLLVTGKWRELFARSRRGSAVLNQRAPTEVATQMQKKYRICRYEIRFAYTLGHATLAPPHTPFPGGRERGESRVDVPAGACT